MRVCKTRQIVEPVAEQEDVLTTQETGCARAWLSESTPGSSMGYDVGVDIKEGVSDNRVDGNALEERCVDAVRYFSQVKR